MKSLQIVLVQCQELVSAEEITLSKSLNISIIVFAQLTSSTKFYLRFSNEGLSLFLNEAKAPGAVIVNFSQASMQRRMKNSISKQGIVKAVGIKRSNLPSIVDGTAGLGKDSFLLASLGCSVTMYERSPIVHALLADGLQRGATADAAVAAVIPNLQLRNFNFDATIKLDQSVDVVYLDPMFPESKRSARVKKDMYLLQRLLGGEQQARSKQENQRDEFNLLDAAKNIAEKRVVVKRGKASPYMGACKPDVEFKGSSNRYDVYLSV